MAEGGSKSTTVQPLLDKLLIIHNIYKQQQTSKY